jgi:DNA-binding NtrC family response regulator/serine/threonine protein kinase/Flp pilus assembly protein TadD
MKTWLQSRFELIHSMRDSRHGSTFLANDHLSGRLGVIVKIIRKGYFTCDRNALSDFFTWYEGLQHPHIAKFYEAGMTPRQDLYCIREFLPRSSCLTGHETQAAAELLSTVSFLHSKGQVHGRIRPSNIFFDTSLRLTDSRPALVGRGEITEEDIRFTAPEVIGGRAVTFESDLYSAGLVLYRILSGRDPFDDFELSNLKSKYLWASAKPLSSMLHITGEVSDGIARLLQRNPHKRWAGCSALLNVFKEAEVTLNRAPLIGRSSEVEKIRTFLYRSHSVGMRALILEGEVGVGKSRLIEHLQMETAFWNFDFVMTRCSEGMSNGLGLILDSLKDLERRRYALENQVTVGGASHRPVPADSAAATEVDPSGQSDSNWPTERLLSHVVSEFARLGQRHSVIFVIEDIQWADDLILALVNRVAYRALEIPICLVLTKRNDYRPCPIYSSLLSCLGDNLLKLSLKPLQRQQSLILVNYLESSPERQSRIVENSAGNPLFIHSYAGQNSSDRGLPAAIDTAIAAMLSGISRPTRLVLQALSLFEKPTTVALIQKITNLPEPLFQQSSRELVGLGLVDERDSDLIVKHVGVRMKLYSSLANSVRVRLHRAAYLQMKDHQADEAVLAEHAFKGRLFEPAAQLYGTLARINWEKENYRDAMESYKRVRYCWLQQQKPLPPADELRLGRCYAAMGKQTTARRIYERIISSTAAHENPELLSTAYVYLAAMGQNHAASRRIELRKQAIQCLPKDSLLLTHRYLQLSEALISAGDFVSAAENLRAAEAHQCSSDDAFRVANSRAQLFLNQGNFLQAAQLMRSICLQSQVNAMTLNNFSFCLEKLGRLSEAKTVQTKAQSMAITKGFLPIQVMSLANLGSIETKLGNFREAEQLFEQGAEFIDRIRLQDRHLDFRSLLIVLADAAYLHLERGHYRLAADSLRKLNTLDPSRYQADNVHIGLTKCDLYFRFGATELVRETLGLLETLPAFRTNFYETERALLIARLDSSPSGSVIELLKDRVGICLELGTLHQQCKVLNELAYQLVLLNQIREAAQYASQSLKIAKQNGFRPLLAQAMLLRGLVAEESRHRDRWLALAFRMATQIGMPELVAESAFHIGVHQMNCGHHLTAKEYLLKSTSITSELVEQIPLKFRSRYLAKTWRKEARRLLDECAKRIEPPVLAIHGEPREAHQDERLFRGLYRLTVSSGVAKDVDSFISSLVQTLDTGIRRRAVVMLKRDGKVDWHPVRVKLSEDLIRKVAGLSEKAKGRIYFGGEKNPTKDTVAWVPFKSERSSGGVYVSCRPMEPPLAERELEFLTILGTIASGALDHIELRNIETPRVRPAAEFHGMIGSSRVMREVYSHVEAAGRTATTVLIEGESGTGKELVAKAIHKCSPRAAGPFIAVDCGAIPETLIESELFGSKKGAFTGAVTDRPGLFEAANKGTIFLDEIGNTSPGLQVKLLRAIQEREIRRIGETRGRPVDVRLITATNHSLEKLVQENRFRTDLLYRLKVLHIKLPSLRSRREDIPLLAQTFLDRLNATNKAKKTFGTGFLRELPIYSYPGNIRELQNIVERAFFLATGSAITGFPIESPSTGDDPVAGDEVSTWFRDLTEGRKNFWSAVHDKYKNRDISRQKVMALVDFGLTSTRGSYKSLASSFRLREKEYRRFMDFLRRNDCLLDFRPYRKAASAP